MKRQLQLALILAALLLSTLPVWAQDGKLIVENDTQETVGAADLQSAAQPLGDRGATVAIYFLQKGERDEFNQHLRADGLMQGDLLLDSLIAIFVSLDDRYSEIAFGDNFTAALNPNLRERAYIPAFTQTSEEIEKALASPGEPSLFNISNHFYALSDRDMRYSNFTFSNAAQTHSARPLSQPLHRFAL